MTKTRVPIDDRWIVNATELSHLLKLSGTDIRRLKGEGMPVMTKKGPKGGAQFYVRDVVSWYIDRMRERIDEEFEQLNLEQERARQASASADKLYLEVAVRKRELVRIDLVEEPVRRFAKQLADIITAIPMRLKNRAPFLTSTELDVVRDELARISNECVDLPAKLEL